MKNEMQTVPHLERLEQLYSENQKQQAMLAQQSAAAQLAAMNDDVAGTVKHIREMANLLRERGICLDTMADLMEKHEL